MMQTTSRVKVLAHNLRQTAIALDQLVNALVGAVLALLRLAGILWRPVGLWWADETISAHCWRLRHFPVWGSARKCVDALLFFDSNHCEESYKSEVLRLQCPPELRANEVKKPIHSQSSTPH